MMHLNMEQMELSLVLVMNMGLFPIRYLGTCVCGGGGSGVIGSVILVLG